MWKKNSFVDISSTNSDTLLLSPYHQCFETRSIEVFCLFSQPLPHLAGYYLQLSNVLGRISRLSYEPFYATNTSHRKQETFLYAYLGTESFYPHKSTQQNAALRYYTPHARSPFWLLKPASKHAHTRLLPRLSWSWTVLLPSDTNRNSYAHYSCFTSMCVLFTDSPALESSGIAEYSCPLWADCFLFSSLLLTK
jgi:hypothetical protein